MVREQRTARVRASVAIQGSSVRWSRYETDKFYDALRMFGTDFTLIASRFPNRSRKQIKAKFVKEESRNSIAVTWALRNPFPMPEECGAKSAASQVGVSPNAQLTWPRADPFALPFPSMMRGWPREDIETYWDRHLMPEVRRLTALKAGEEPPPARPRPKRAAHSDARAHAAEPISAPAKRARSARIKRRPVDPDEAEAADWSAEQVADEWRATMEPGAHDDDEEDWE